MSSDLDVVLVSDDILKSLKKKAPLFYHQLDCFIMSNHEKQDKTVDFVLLQDCLELVRLINEL